VTLKQALDNTMFILKLKIHDENNKTQAEIDTLKWQATELKELANKLRTEIK
jgi:hypothetical protein